MDALMMGVEGLATITGMSPTTIRYFGLKPAALSTVNQINSALGLPTGHLQAILRRELPEPVVQPDTLLRRLIRVERKVDELLAMSSQLRDLVCTPQRDALDMPPMQG
jgi:hypothetical protein